MEATIRSIATNIRKVREYREYTQEYMSMKLGITQNAYSKIELMYTKITVERFLQITFLLDVEPQDIIKKDITELIQLHSVV